MSDTPPIPSPPTPQPSDSPPLLLRPALDQLGALTDYIQEFGMLHGFSPGDTHAFTLAAEELFANTLRHGQPPATQVELSLIADAVSAAATYADDGQPFDPTSLPAVDTALPASQRDIGGLGIHFIRKTMPVFRYERRNGQNLTTFGRPLTSK